VAKAKIKFDWFLTGLIVAVLLAWLFPEPGAKGGWLHADLLNKCGVALIFFLHGVGLSFAALKAGTLRWPLHLLVQSMTFLIFPVIGLVIYLLTAGYIHDDLRLGYFYLCALPSAISSSVAMTAAARGNVPAAVFNASLSSVIGVFITPIWIGLLLKTGGKTLPLGEVILDLVQWLILPLVVGQLCRPWLADFVHRHKKGVHMVDRLTILMLVYTSFCESMKQGVWSGQGPLTVILTIAASAGLFGLVMWINGLIADRMKLPLEDRITGIFCGSKKSLATGVPMAQLIFAGHPGVAFILLPIMVYHTVQLIICGWLAGRWAERKEL
jgi:solute carrier family 10 (sodium/bile acid cotransporter), member 7